VLLIIKCLICIWLKLDEYLRNNTECVTRLVRNVRRLVNMGNILLTSCISLNIPLIEPCPMDLYEKLMATISSDNVDKFF
jgi:hypothetical protein